MSRDRQAALRRGRLAETLAVWRLRLAGWRILARQWRVPAGEIDIVARRGRVLAAVEVKARASLEAAGEAISPRQRRRIARALEHFVARHPQHQGAELRFDVVLVLPGRIPRHLSAAWRADD